MKNSLNPRIVKFIALLLVAGTTMTACLDDSCEETRRFIEYEPIYVQPEEFRIPVINEAPREMEETGKFYFQNNKIFINEKNKGIHIIDNSDPISPQNVAFINIPGNLDIAIRNNILYADNYVDLLTIDISDIENPRTVCRDEDVFANYNYSENRGYYVGLKGTGRTIMLDCNDPNINLQQFTRGGFELLSVDSGLGNNIDEINTGDGQGGSLARFTLYGDYLYVINQSELISYNVDRPEKPQMTNTTAVNWNIETLFPYKENLFIGSQSGLFIYGLTEPSAPKYISQFNHANACDPVFVKDDIAYVTLRDGNLCQNFINQLDVIDVSLLSNPQLLKSYDMEHPHGLSVRDNHLYLCEGTHGLKVYDVTELDKIDKNRIEHIKGIDAFDAISLSSDHLLVIGSDGLHQYDTSDADNLEELSYFPVGK